MKTGPDWTDLTGESVSQPVRSVIWIGQAFKSVDAVRIGGFLHQLGFSSGPRQCCGISYLKQYSKIFETIIQDL